MLTPVRSRLCTPGNFTALPVWNQVRHRVGVLGLLQKAGLRTSLDLFRIICILQMFIFLGMKTPAFKKEFTSECRLQTRLTIYKCKNINLYFILLTTFIQTESLVRNVPLRLSRKSHHLSPSSFNATASPSLTWSEAFTVSLVRTTHVDIAALSLL